MSPANVAWLRSDPTGPPLVSRPTSESIMYEASGPSADVAGPAGGGMA